MQVVKPLLRKCGINRELIELKIKHNILHKPYYWSEFPRCIQIDISNYCGPKYSGILCSYCHPQHQIACGKDRYCEMPLEWIEYIIRQFHKYGSRKPTDPYKSACAEFLAFFLNGDGLTDPRLPDICKLQKRIAPWLTNQTFTCGTNTQNADWLCNPDLDWVCVTLSAPNREIYKRVHGGDKFFNVLQTLKYLQDHAPSKTKLEVHYVITQANIDGMRSWQELIHKEFPRFRKVFSPLVASKTNPYSLQAMGNLTLECQEAAIDQVNPNDKFWNHQTTGVKQPCVLWNNFSIKSDLTMLQCCNWAATEIHNYGKLPEVTRQGLDLKDIWNMRNANKQNNPLCQTCSLKHPQHKERLAAMNFQCKIQPKPTPKIC